MSTTLISSFVNALFGYIRNHLKECDGALTSESFLIALIDRVDVATASAFRDEAMAVKATMKNVFPERSHIRQRMFDYFAQDRMSLMHSKVAFRQMIQKLTDQSITITANRLLSEILENPSKAIREAMEEQEYPAVSAVADLDKEKALLAGRKARRKREVAEEAVAQVPQVQASADGVSKLIAEVKDIRTKLLSAVYGQDNAVQTFVSGYFEAKMLAMIDKDRSRPLATFLFAGPPGVGKTFLAETIADALGELPFKRLDMSEYADKEANIELCGSDKVYRNGSEGNLTSFVKRNPRCVLLFDEVEKAHLVVIHQFLQMLDAGRIRDNYTDEEVSFSDAIVIFTTNAGKQLYEASETEDLSSLSRKAIIRALEQDRNPEKDTPYFPAAICSRFASGNVVMFNHMSAHHLCNIAQKQLNGQAENLCRGTGLQTQFDERLSTALLFSQGGSVDARVIKSRAEALFADELYELMRMVDSAKATSTIADLKSIEFCLELDSADPSVNALFTPQKHVEILAITDQATLEDCRAKVPDLEWHTAQTLDEAKQVLKLHDIRMVLLDMNSGTETSEASRLNIEDVDSLSRRLLVHLCETQSNVPQYLLHAGGVPLDEEETVSFRRRGVRGVVEVAQPADALAAEMAGIVRELHRQDGIITLTRQNKLLSFETAQVLSEDGSHATIRLFDFKLTTAIDAEDAENVLSALSMPEDTFDDVIGAEETKKELMYFVEYLKDPKRYAETGVKAPKGVLMYGPPGTGKTMLARAMAHEAGVTFLAAEGNMFLKSRAGEGAELVHRLFRTARKYAPAVLFVDEIDSVARERQGYGDETVLTAFLTEMDGFRCDPSRPVFVLAATNFDVAPGHPKSLDGALLRRFDRRILVDLPDCKARRRFLEKKREDNAAIRISDAMLDSIALRATGLSLATLDSIAELSLRSAIRAGSTTVTDEIFEEAFENFNNGEKKQWDAALLERVARHEAGHTLLCWLGGETPSYLTVVAREGHGGYMQHAEREDRPLYTKAELLWRIRTSLGGRAAELVCYGPEDGLSTGAANDLERATALAKRLIGSYGMSDAVGLLVIDPSTMMSVAELRKAVSTLLCEQMQVSQELITRHRGKLDRLVEALMDKTHLTGKEIEQILSE